MLPYHKEEMVYDCIKGKDVIVFDINIQLLFDLDRVARRIKVEFPEVVKLLRIKAINEQLYPGDSVVIQVRGFTVVALITMADISGPHKDDPETINMFTMQAIDDMLKKVNKSSHFVSGILNRKTSKWDRIAYHITNKKLNWSIYTE